MKTTIYMPLLHEGTDVWCPVIAEELGDGWHRVVGQPCDGEEWAFAAGAVVMVDVHRRIVSATNP